MIFVPATEQHVEAVLLNLSDVCAGELAAVGAGVADAYRMATRSPGAVTLLDDEEPILLFGHDYQDPSTRYTWTLAAVPFYERFLATTRAAKRHLADLVRRYPGVTFLSYSASPHPKADRWQELLGFELVGKDAQFRIFALRGA